jgi:hypothetical protein
MSSNPSESLLREQLLSALDREINDLQSARNSNGRTRWALTLSSAGLFWLGIQLWDTSNCSSRNVALLATAMTLLWDFLLKLTGSLDSPLLPRQATHGRFLPFSHLIGALRSTILFIGLKNAAMLAAVFWVQPPAWQVLAGYLIYSLLLVTIGFVVSYWDVPPIPVLDPPDRSRKFILGLRASPWLVRLLVLGSAVYALASFPHPFAAADVRLGAVVAAAGYLLTLLLDDQFSASHLNAWRAVRQNLAFGHISADEAKNQVDLLQLSGGSGMKAVQRTPDAILATADEIRADYLQVEASLAAAKQTVNALGTSLGSDETLQLPLADNHRLQKHCKDLFNRASAMHDKLLERVKTFELHVEFAGHLSVSAAEEAKPLIEKLKIALAPLSEQREKLKAALSS